jgi:hypothetical protein
MSALRNAVVFMVVTAFILVVFYQTLAPALVLLFTLLEALAPANAPGSIGDFANVTLIWIPLFFGARSVLALAFIVFQLLRSPVAGGR